MKPEACMEVASKSRNQAEAYLHKENYGRAFAHFLVALKLHPQWKAELKEQFSSCLCSWGNILESQNRYKDLFTCYEQALEIFAENDAVLNNLGAHLYRSNHQKEALHYFKKAAEINSENLEALRNIQNVKNLLVERWHFRMLNDSCRNRAFREAVIKKVRQGYNTVLDIGTGTGILSLFAVEAGAKEVYACDVSSTMICIAEKVFSANNADGKVKLINKMSNELKIPEDIPHRVSLVVTETVDAGLVGEGILQTISHAWSVLMQPGAEAIPARACMKLTAVSSSYIASMCRASVSEDGPFFISEMDGPYDTDDVTNLPGGLRMLTPVTSAMHIDFRNKGQMLKLSSEETLFSYSVKCVADGCIDAAVAWFELSLDDTVTLSSEPGHNSCWDQAIFPVKIPIPVAIDDVVCLNIMLSGGKINIDVVGRTDAGHVNSKLELEKGDKARSAHEQSLHDDINETLSTVSLYKDLCISVSPEMVRALNDVHWVSTVRDVSRMGQVVSRQRILDLSHFPLLGLSLLKEQEKTDCYLVCVALEPGDELAIRTWAKIYGIDNYSIKCIREHSFHDMELNRDKFDLIMVQAVEVNGELSEKTFTSLSTVRKLLKENGILLPNSVSVDFKLVQSKWLKTVSGVCDIECTCGYDIADFINEFQVCQHLDFRQSSADLKDLSETLCLLQMTLSENCETLMTKELTITSTASGCVNAVLYWFRVNFLQGGPEFSTLHSSSYIKNAAFLIDPEIPIAKNQNLNLIIKLFQSIIHIELEEQFIVK